MTRVSHAQDRRSTLIAITPAGRELAQRATEVLNAAGFATDPLSDDELEAVTRLLTSIRRHEGDFADGAFDAADDGAPRN